MLCAANAGALCRACAERPNCETDSESCFHLHSLLSYRVAPMVESLTDLSGRLTGSNQTASSMREAKQSGNERLLRESFPAAAGWALSSFAAVNPPIKT